ncbi:MAG: hypothetical protein UW24_C0007G0045 [Parcubacteria group bacterium GW2011_GWA2_44_12]|nr:MAG: hypothetical protein UW24_C0007G0045 [Parcubacteria group bacterium GW2011_GWA2_44_12]
MKILMFGWELPPFNSGGLGVACHGLTKALAKENICVRFVLPKRIGNYDNFLNILFGDDFTSSPSATKWILALLNPYIPPLEYEAIRLEHGLEKLFGPTLFDEVGNYAIKAHTIAKAEPHNIIHAHDWLSFLAGIEAKRVSGNPLVVHVHATEFDRTGGSCVNQTVYEIERKGVQAADAVIAVSKLTKDTLTQHYGVAPDKISVIYNSVDHEEHEAPIKDLALAKAKLNGYGIVLFAGRLTLQKGPDYFLRAAQKVLEHNEKVLFLIAGNGDMEVQILETAIRLGIIDKIFFTGFLRGDELKQLYRAADVFVMPSVSEPFGITVLESLVNGTPVLISKRSGVSEVIHHALKVDFWDIDDTADKIIAALKHPPLRQCLREYGKQEVYQYSWYDAAKHCLQLYSKLLKTAPAY